ncbi:hypothetical protein T5B8_16754 [Salinisphaera sp. T5B8]
MTVHPRGCGEHIVRQNGVNRDYGSSPRVRGTRVQFSRAEGEKRFIPAGAGNTTKLASRRGHEPVHPRGCGEHVTIVTL